MQTMLEVQLHAGKFEQLNHRHKRRNAGIAHFKGIEDIQQAGKHLRLRLSRRQKFPQKFSHKTAIGHDL